jgi:1,4-alpha-glucan branching enzyme
MCELARRFPEADGVERRALNQAAREVMLAQSSDWAFIMRTGTTVPYAVKRTLDHVARFTALYQELTTNAIDEPVLAEVESRDNLFPEIDYRVYAS